MRASSLRRSTRLTSAAISASVAGRFPSSAVKIARTCDTVKAGVFPPHPPPLQDQEPQRQEAQRDMVMPAHPAAHLIMHKPTSPLPSRKTRSIRGRCDRTHTNLLRGTLTSALLMA